MTFRALALRQSEELKLETPNQMIHVHLLLLDRDRVGRKMDVLREVC